MIEAILTIGGIGLISSLGLGLAAKKFAVYVDPKIEAIEHVLPGVNCGACGFTGCRGFAEAVVAGEADAGGCLAGGEAVVHGVAEIMGVEAKAADKVIARLRCQGGKDKAKLKYHYLGISDCQAASLVAGGDKACAFGCLGLGSCVGVCPVEAIKVSPDGLVAVDEELCIGCGKCIAICPKKVIHLVPYDQQVTVLCNSTDKGPLVRKQCQIGCIGCMMCKKVCPVEAVTIEKFLARIDPVKCTICGECVKKCPTKCILMK
jgi:Na+-translocating ferredoxin:NAD+ oxidoreductase RNF subunit RnfB